MELTVKVDDKEGPFVIELLRKFSFVQEVRQQGQIVTSEQLIELWQLKAHKLFATKADFDLWLTTPNSVIHHQSPMSLLGNSEGYQTVNKLLGRLEHGIMA